MACASALVAIEDMMRLFADKRLAYAVDLPRDQPTEDASTPKMPLPFLLEFDGRQKVSAIPHCPALRRSLEERGVSRVGTRRGLPPEGTVAFLATLPILSPDRKQALVRVEGRCAWPCGGGNTFYLVLKDEGWKIVAMRMEWRASPSNTH